MTRDDIILMAREADIDCDTDGDIWGSTNGALLRFAAMQPTTHHLETHTMTTYIIPANIFAAVAKFRAVQDVRYYFKGVCLELGPQGAFIVAANGHALAAAQIDTQAVNTPSSYIIKPEVVEQLEKIKHGTINIEQPLEPGHFKEGKLRNIRITTHAKAGRGSGAASVATGYDTEEMDGRFPDWRRAFRHAGRPLKPDWVITEPPPPVYQAVYHKLVDDAARLIKGTKKDSPAAIIKPGYDYPAGYAQLDHDGKVGAWVMPFRVNIDEMPTPPAWASPS